MRKRWIALAAALIFAIGALSAVAAFLGTPLEEQREYGTPAIGGPFRLTNQYGERVGAKDLAGKYMLVYFGYTYCPDICPLTLMNMTEALERLPDEEAEQVVPVFITVDPARDTVEHLAEYASLFHPRLLALTGTDAEVKAAARAYRVYFSKVEGKDDEPYLMDHSSFVYLMGPDGKYVAHFGHDATPEEMSEGLRQAIGSALVG